MPYRSTTWIGHPNFTILCYTLLYYNIIYYIVFYEGGGAIPISFKKVGAFPCHYNIRYSMFQTWRRHSHLFQGGGCGIPVRLQCYAIPHCNILWYDILKHTTLYDTILYHTTLYYTILYFTILYLPIPYDTILYFALVYYIMLFYSIL